MNVAQLTRWTSQLEVPWSTFIETLCMHLQLALPPNYDVLTPETSAIHCVKELVCVNDHVTAAKFGRLIGCFAPLDGLFLHRVRRHRGVFVALRCVSSITHSALEQIQWLMSLRWFHGDLPTPLAENLLLSRVRYHRESEMASRD